VPVRITSLSIEEQQYSPLLYPVRAKATLGVKVPVEVTEFLAHKITSNVRELDAAARAADVTVNLAIDLYFGRTGVLPGKPALWLARVIESDLKIRSVALAVANSPEVEIGRKNIMGVVVPNIGEVELRKTALNRGYGLYTSAAVDEAAAEYEKVVEKGVRAAEIETSMRKLLKEIEKTKRRVNALEFEVIPKLDRTKSFIQLRLEEAERENIFRMKIIKRKHAA